MTDSNKGHVDWGWPPKSFDAKTPNAIYPDYRLSTNLKGHYLELLRKSLQNLIYPQTETAVLADPPPRQHPWPLYSHTMLSPPKMDTIRYCIEHSLENDIEGDVIETGVWRGGACIFMEGILQANSALHKKVYVADSFEGLPPPEFGGREEDKASTHHRQDHLKVSIEKVKDNFKKYNLLKDNVIFVKGFFEDTMKTLDIDKLCLLRLDGDMYSSTMVVLRALYNKVEKGGFVIIDDWEFHPPSRKAVMDFRRDNNIDQPMLKDASGVFWQK